MDPLEAIELELDEDEDAAVYGWLYDKQPLQYTRMVNGPSYRRWKLPLPIMATLYRLAGQVCVGVLPGVCGSVCGSVLWGRRAWAVVVLGRQGCGGVGASAVGQVGLRRSAGRVVSRGEHSACKKYAQASDG